MKTDRRNGLIALVVGLFSLCSNSMLLAQDELEIDDPVQAHFVDKIKEGLKTSFIIRANLRLDDIQRFLKLEDSQVAKSKILIKGVSGKKGKAAGERVAKYVQRVWAQHAISDAETFSVNGTFYMIDPEATMEEVSAKADIRVTVDLLNSVMQISRDGGSSGFGLGNREGKLSEMEFWKRALKGVDANSLEDFEDFEKQRAHRGTVRGVLVFLESELELSKEQSRELEELIGDKILTSRNGKLDSIHQTFVENREIFSVEPDFLSDAQLKKWQLMKFSARKPNWN